MDYGRDAFSALRILEEIKRKPQESKPKLKGPVPEVLTQKPRPELRPQPIPCVPSFHIHRDNPVPKAPFYGARVLKQVRLQEIFPWVNKTPLYRLHWQFKQGERTPREFELYLKENVDPILEKFEARCIRERILEPKAIYGYFPCYSEGNDLAVLDETARVEKVRFRFPRQRKEPYQCVADFFRPRGVGELDVVAFQMVTMGGRASEIEKKLFTAGKYTEYLYLHGLSVETAEAFAEYLHAQIRREMGIHLQDKRYKEEIFRQGYQGSRYSFGYPACPNLEDQKKLFELIPANKIGVSLSETFQMVPEQSTSAIIVHHPQAKYFGI